MSSEANLLSVQDLKKYFTGDTGLKLLILDNLNFSFSTNEQNGKIKTILAPFGAGKSTLLKTIAGIEKKDAGKIFLNGKEYDKVIGEVVYIPEKPSSFPWLNVRDNIELPLKSSHTENSNSVNNLISLVGLAGYEDHFPHNKSFGFRFRISLARALAVNPKIILIDDSFKSMDAETKSELYNLILNISRELKINFLLATTDIHEAIFLSDEIFLMKKNPGSIFKEVTVDKNIIRKDFVVTDEIISTRNEIESYFRKELLETTNFSV